MRPAMSGVAVNPAWAFDAAYVLRCKRAVERGFADAGGRAMAFRVKLSDRGLVMLYAVGEVQ